MIDNCEHSWLRVHEQSLLGGPFPVGWQCEKCNKYLANANVTPSGLPGVVTNKHKLVGVHGTNVITATGKKCSSQIYDGDTKLLSYVEHQT